MDYKNFAEKIIELKDKDLKLRNKLVKAKKLGEGYDKQMEQLHNKNAEELDTIIKIIGYPSAEKVGKKASEATWLIIQHAIGKPDFMKKCMKLLEEEAKQNKSEKIHSAYLADRIAVFEGKLQLYGTQFDWDKEGNLSPHNYDDLERVNERRKSIGLVDIEEQTLILRRQAENENLFPPKDSIKRKREREKWKKKVGWIQ